MRRLFALAFVLSASTSQAQAASDAQGRDAERDLLERIVEIPTVAGRGEMPRLVNLLAEEFRKIGLTNIVVKDHFGLPGDQTQTMIVSWPAAKPSGKKPILLMAHMDVVDAKRSDWEHEPFKLREADGYYWGRGVSDNKGGVAAILATLGRLKASGFHPSRDIIVLFTGDEETKQDGVRLATTEWRELIDAELALNIDSGGGGIYKDGRPQYFFIQVAEKTYADFRFTAANRGGHSSVPRPDNAIYQLAGALKNLEEHRFPPMLNDATRAMFEGVVEKDKGAWGETVRAWLDDPTDMEKADLVEANRPGYTRTRCVATELSAGHAPNALPQTAQATVNCRIFPGVKTSDVQEQLQRIAGEEVKVELVDGGVWSDASPLRDDVVNAYRAAIQKRFPGAPVAPSMSAGGTDSVFTRAAGIPSYGVGGWWGYVSEPSGIHGLNERMLVDAYHGHIDIWEDMLRQLTK